MSALQTVYRSIKTDLEIQTLLSVLGRKMFARCKLSLLPVCLELS